MLVLLQLQACSTLERTPLGEESGEYQAPESEPVILKREAFSEGYKICVIGDGGIGDEKQLVVADRMASEGCDRVHYVGDVIYEEGIKGPDDPLFMANFYRPYEHLLDQNTSFYMIMGNHDYGGSPGAWLDLAKRYEGKIIFPHYYYAQEAGDICLIGIDTNIIDDEKQQHWIEETLEKFKQDGCKFTMAWAHHPYESSGQYGQGTEGVKTFLNQLILGKVDLYVTGHDHLLSDEGTYKGTRMLVSGGGGQGLYRVRARKEKVYAKSTNGFLVLVVKRDKGDVFMDYKIIQATKEKSKTLHEGQVKGLGVRL